MPKWVKNSILYINKILFLSTDLNWLIYQKIKRGYKLKGVQQDIWYTEDSLLGFIIRDEEVY